MKFKELLSILGATRTERIHDLMKRTGQDNVDGLFECYSVHGDGVVTFNPAKLASNSQFRESLKKLDSIQPTKVEN